MSLVEVGAATGGRVELAEIHFNEILGLGEDKDDGSVFQICHLSFLPPLLLLFLLLFQPFRNRSRCLTMTSSGSVVSVKE